MRGMDIKELRKRYEKYLEEGTHGYFEPDELVLISESYEQDMSYRKALKAVLYGLELYPTSEMLLLRKAICLLMLGRVEDASQALSAVTEHNLEYYFTCAELNLVRQDNEATLHDFLDIIRSSECTIEDCIDVLDMCADYDKVELLPLITPVVESRFDDVSAYWREVAILYEEKDNNTIAAELYNKVLDVNPYSVDDWFSLAKLYARTKDYTQALEACDFALAIAPNDESIIAFKGYCYYDNNQFNDAVEQFKLFLQCTSDKAVAYELIAEASGRMEKHEEAIEYLLKAVALNDRNHDLYYQLAINHYYMGHIDDAVYYLRKAVACDDSDDEAHMLLGELLLQKQEYEESYKHLSRLQLNPLVDTVPAAALADVCIQLERYDEAAEVLMLLIKQDIFEPHYYFDVILCYMQMGDYDTAVKWVARAEEIADDAVVMSKLDADSRQAWQTIKDQIDKLRNILSVYLDKKL